MLGSLLADIHYMTIVGQFELSNTASVAYFLANYSSLNLHYNQFAPDFDIATHFNLSLEKSGNFIVSGEWKH